MAQRPGRCREQRTRLPNFPWTMCSAGAGWRRRPATRCGTTMVRSRSRRAGPARPRCRRTRGAAAPPFRAGHGKRRGPATSPGRRELVAEAESVSAAIGSVVAPWASLRLLALRGREAEATAADREHVRAAPSRSARYGDVRALGGRRPVQRARPSRGGGSGGPAKTSTNAPSGLPPCGRCPSWSRRPRAREIRSSLATH